MEKAIWQFDCHDATSMTQQFIDIDGSPQENSPDIEPLFFYINAVFVQEK